MVVSCQKCRTRFQLDEARIPAKGVRVRCSKCKHAFFVAPPASHDETIHGLAQQAAVQGRPAKPRIEASVDLPPVASGEPEDDWQFNIDPPRPGDAPLGRDEPDDATPPPAEITDSEPTESGSVESFFELDGLSDPGPERESGAPDRAAAAPEVEPAAAPPAKGRRRAPPPIEPEQEVTFEDLGQPGGWDFGVPETSPAASAAPAKRVKASPARQPAPRKERAARVEVEDRPAAVRPQAGPRSRVETVLGALAGAAGWLLAAALFGFGLHGALPSAPSAQGVLPPLRIGALELAEVRVRHVENLLAGPVVVVTGELRNPASAPVQGAAGRVRITDAQGQALGVAPAWLGVVVSPAELRQADPAELAAAQARSARVLAERSFEPQDRISVTAVLAELPPEAVAFRIEEGALSELPDPEQLPVEPVPAASDPGEGTEPADPGVP